MTNTISLKDNYSLQIVADNWDKVIYVWLTDDRGNKNTLLSTWRNGKWSMNCFNGGQFFELAKKYSKIKRCVRNAFEHIHNTEYETTIKKTWTKLNCFKRRVRMKFYKIIH
jgi:hypothetical protein